jgi:hypothetical protein
MKYATEMGSGAMIYIPSFIKIGSGIQKLMGEGYSQTHRRHGDQEPTLGNFLPSFSSALQLRVNFGLLDNLPPFFSIPRLTVWFLNNLVFMV